MLFFIQLFVKSQVQQTKLNDFSNVSCGHLVEDWSLTLKVFGPLNTFLSLIWRNKIHKMIFILFQSVSIPGKCSVRFGQFSTHPRSCIACQSFEVEWVWKAGLTEGKLMVNSHMCFNVMIVKVRPNCFYTKSRNPVSKYKHNT
jgi:hypothetical protein